jgi:hypothetical protein
MELRLPDPDYASLFEVLDPQPPELATAQACRIQENRRDSGDFSAQRGVVGGSELVRDGQHPTDLVRFYDYGSYVRAPTGKSVWTGHEGVRVQASAKPAEPMNNLLRLAAGVGMELELTCSPALIAR